MRDRFLIAVVLAILTLGGSLALAASHATSVVAPVTTPKDSRVFAPYLKQAIPNWSANTGDAVNFNLKDYYAAGDVLVTNSAIAGCTSIAPVFTAGGTIAPGTALTVTDKNNATWGGTTSGSAANNTYTIKVTNCADATGFTDSIDWAITAAAGSGTIIPEGGVNYFVCNTGSDTGAGNTLATRWQTVGKVNGAFSSSTTSHAKVWFCAGATFSNQALTVDWNGTSSDPVIVGTYYVSGGVAYQDTPTNYTISTRPSAYAYGNGARAIIEGTYQDSCRKSAIPNSDPTKHCSWGGIGGSSIAVAGTAVPTGGFSPLVSLKGAYQIIQDMEIRSSAGRGLMLESSGSGCGAGIANNVACEAHAIARRNHVHHSAQDGLDMTHGSYFVALQNEVDHTNLANIDGLATAGSSLTVQGPSPARALVEGNDIHDGYGENVGIYITEYVLLRGNYSANSRRADYNSGSGGHFVSEQNTNAGGTVAETSAALLTDPYYLSAGHGPAFWSQAYENDALGGCCLSYGSRLLFRNNLIGDPSPDCFSTYMQVGRTAPNTVFEWNMLGNTCVAPTRSAWSWSAIDFTLVSYLHHYNNLNNVKATSCASQNVQKATHDYNQWTTAQSVSTCSGAHDVVGATGFTTGFNFANSSWSSFPVPADFKPSGASAGVAHGNTYTTDTVIDNSQGRWDWVLSQRVWLPACNTTAAQVPTAEWLKDLTTDYCGNSRGTGATDIGAILQ